MAVKRLFIVLILALQQIVTGAQDHHAMDSLTALLNSEDDPSRKIGQYIDLSDAVINSDVVLSLDYAKKAFDLAEEISDDGGQWTACIQLAMISFYMSDLDQAMEYAEQAKELAEAMDNELFLARSMDAIGAIYYDIGNQAKSSENFFASLKIYESLKDKEGVGSTYCRIGTLYLDQEDYDQAADYYLRSIQLAREINSSEGIASNLNNLAKVFYRTGEYSKALKTYGEALQINIESGDLYLAGSNYLNIADVYKELKDYPNAISRLELARGIFENLGNKIRLAKSMVMLSEIYKETGQKGASEQTAIQALSIGQSQEFSEIIIGASRVLYNLNISKGDSATALKYFMLEKQYQDSLFLDEKQKTLATLELQHQFEKNEQQQKIARQRRNVAIAAISGILFFSLVILLLVIKQMRLKSKKLELEKAGVERELDFKNKELVLNVMSLMQKNEMLADLSEKLIRIDESATTPESKDTIKKVAHELQKSQEKEIWKEFQHRFKEVHGEFYEKLLAQYPTLTPNELKLCAFLRLNMSSKDIAELTGQRVSSLETARYRLRQKLGIANSDVNLITFLSSI